MGTTSGHTNGQTNTIIDQTNTTGGQASTTSGRRVL